MIRGGRLNYVRKMEYAIWSQDFLEDPADMQTCFLDETEWRRIHAENSDAKRIIAAISTDEQTYYIALGRPVRNSGIESDTPALFIPPWLCTWLSVGGDGTSCTVEWLTEESFPEATRIKLRPHDSVFFDANIKDELDYSLTQYGVLKRGTTIPVCITSMGGLVVYVDVVETEPADCILLQGDDVAIEFDKAWDDVPAACAAEVPAAHAAEVEKSFDTDMPFIAPPEPTAPTAPGQVLGGVSRPPGPDGKPWNPWRVIA